MCVGPRINQQKEEGGWQQLFPSYTEIVDSAVGVREGVGDDKYLITRMECFYPALNVINCYGEQRSSSKEDVLAKWGRLRSAMERIRASKEFCQLHGDFNKLVGHGKYGVEGNKA